VLIVQSHCCVCPWSNVHIWGRTYDFWFFLSQANLTQNDGVRLTSCSFCLTFHWLGSITPYLLFKLYFTFFKHFSYFFSFFQFSVSYLNVGFPHAFCISISNLHFLTYQCLEVYACSTPLRFNSLSISLQTSITFLLVYLSVHPCCHEIWTQKAKNLSSWTCPENPICKKF
jgi:hypothetical protein